MKKLLAIALALCMVLSIACFASAESDDLIKVGIINNDPTESGYRAANVADMEKVFCEENGYDAQFFYSLKNEEQIAAAHGGTAVFEQNHPHGARAVIRLPLGELTRSA